ncbi:MerR family DNA-binding transcriptional regulator [Alteromonadaceae bacterium M269]|nr:MerR family DNA-binding transcriptional regulator [Alteromonadaceae bacterium M269]
MAESDAVSIGELAKKFDITPRSIRFYEEQGLLSPGRVGQNRSYQKKDQVRLKLILRGKRLGFLLAEIKTLFELYDSHSNSVAQLETMLSMTKEKRTLMLQQLHDVNMVLQELDEVEHRCMDELAELTNPTKLQRES